MKNLCQRFVERLKNEPQLIGSAVLVALNIAAAFGLDVTEEQRNAILTGVPAIIGIAFGVRSQVRPERMVPKGPQPAETRPPLTTRRGRR